MRFSCEKAILQSAVAVVSRAVSSRSSMPALEGIHIKAENGLVITGYDLETGIRTIIPAEVKTGGSIVLNAKIFGEIIRKMPDDMVTVSVDDSLLTSIKCGLSEFNIIGIRGDEFPEIPDVEFKNSFSIPQKILRSMIGQTIFAVSDNENKPIHTGSLFEVGKSTLSIVSVDGFRLAVRRENIERDFGEEPFSFVAPGKALKEIEKIMDDTDEHAGVTLGSHHIMFTVGKTTLVSRVLEGEFLNYENAIPRDASIIITADTKSIIDSVERVSLIINEKLKTPLRCTFGNNEIEFRCTTAIGKAYDKCLVDGSGQDMEIGFNNRYLMEALKAASEPKIKINIKNGLSPCIITPEEGDKFLFMVLPVRLKANEN